MSGVKTINVQVAYAFMMRFDDGTHRYKDKISELSVCTLIYVIGQSADFDDSTIQKAVVTVLLAK